MNRALRKLLCVFDPFEAIGICSVGASAGGGTDGSVGGSAGSEGSVGGGTSGEGNGIGGDDGGFGGGADAGADGIGGDVSGEGVGIGGSADAGYGGDLGASADAGFDGPFGGSMSGGFGDIGDNAPESGLMGFFDKVWDFTKNLHPALEIVDLAKKAREMEKSNMPKADQDLEVGKSILGMVPGGKLAMEAVAWGLEKAEEALGPAAPTTGNEMTGPASAANGGETNGIGGSDNGVAATTLGSGPTTTRPQIQPATRKSTFSNGGGFFG